MSKELFEGAVVAGKEKIRKLRKKQYLCIFVIAYMVFCMILLPDSLMFAIGLVVIGFAGFKFWKFRKEYNLHKTLLESNEGVLRAINSSEEEEYDDPNVKYSAADLLGTSSDDEDDACEEEEEYDDPNATYSAADLLGISSDDEGDACEEEEEYDDPNATYSAADLLGTSSSKTTKKTKNTKTTKTTKRKSSK